MKDLLKAQKAELTEYHIYSYLAKLAKPENKKILEKVAKDELKHYNILKKITKQDVSIDSFKLKFYTFLARTIGLTFTLKLMERNESIATQTYLKLRENYPEIEKLLKDEEEHEQLMLDMFKDEALEHSSSIVLGLNDALVELTGALAGLTFTLKNTQLIGVVGLITGIAASLSMAASNYLSKKEDNAKNPLESAMYTGFAYIITVLLLVIPYFFISSNVIALLAMLLIAIIIITIYNYYISIAKSISFKKHFLEMTLITLSISIITFLIGYLIKVYFGIDV